MLMATQLSKEPEHMSANALEIRGLKKSFKTFTLGPVDLTVPMGAIYGFVGPNGSGKTTTIDMIFGLGERTEAPSASSAWTTNAMSAP